MEPTEKDLESPEFNAVWDAIKKWDICRRPGAGYAHATGTDVMAILEALRSVSHDSSPAKESILELKDGTSLEEAVGLALGAASVCWDPMDGKGVFLSTRCGKIGEELVEYIRSIAIDTQQMV